ncbi:MAG: YtxH domain-containing protein [Bacteroidetes bacterium]|nr:MAG: YtxH domain-containing protein [Bacteroidota bacterium]
MSATKVLAGIAAGLGLGAVLGVLFAPHKGSDTRSKIANKSTNTVNDLKLKFSNLMDEIAHTIDEEKGEIKGAYSKANSKMEQITHDEPVA